MAITFKAIQEYQDEPIVLPIPGRNGEVQLYELPIRTGEDWTRLAAIERAQRTMQNGTQPAPADLEALRSVGEREYGELLLGADNLVRMETAHVHHKLLHAAMATASAFHLIGVEAAELAWTRAIASIEKSVDPTRPPQEAGEPESDGVTPSPVSTRRTTPRKKPAPASM